MLYLMKAFDIICFDWFLLTKSHFSSIFTQKQKDARATASLALIARSSLRELLFFRFLPRCLRGSVQFYQKRFMSRMFREKEMAHWFYLTVLMNHMEEKWLVALHGPAYKDYCGRANRCIPWFPGRKGRDR